MRQPLTLSVSCLSCELNSSRQLVVSRLWFSVPNSPRRCSVRVSSSPSSKLVTAQRLMGRNSCQDRSQNRVALYLRVHWAFIGLLQPSPPGCLLGFGELADHIVPFMSTDCVLPLPVVRTRSGSLYVAPWHRPSHRAALAHMPAIVTRTPHRKLQSFPYPFRLPWGESTGGTRSRPVYRARPRKLVTSSSWICKSCA